MGDMDPAPVDVLNDEPHFLSEPEVAQALERMLNEFQRETDRGAVLIAGEMVSAQLAAEIRALAPPELRGKRINELLKYPGFLSSFSARCDVALLAGFIDASAHRSTVVLRRLRNDAAHSTDAFSLAVHRERLMQMCSLGSGVAASVSEFAAKSVLDDVVYRLKQRGMTLENEIGRNPFSSAAEIFEHLSVRPDLMAVLDERMPKMELAIGVWLLLGLIVHQGKRRRAERTTGDIDDAN
ncbi:hypothetical protein [Hyphomicrobium sp. CS1BSMeth3]|uniref:hypothetical protein n=1 Tax=Hyphomicrobium sp. CS1BSMeth3 TaxID=1892844 RepID=UPI0009318043|nr:hypothetical protein [Hyphomicrobium sp. CS1BSMeth3]